MQNSGGCLCNERLPDTVFVRSSIGQAATRTVPASRNVTASRRWDVGSVR
ncbi:MAG: hypothetical protein J7J03_00360 [Methanosarcinales archaeon]|nr:hypothetical protein [Methanosarcinales archaeon]